MSGSTPKNVTYLAVVAPATTEVPLIGYLRISLP